MSTQVTPLTVTPGRALVIAGLLPSNHPERAAEKAAYNQIAKRRFPFPLICFAGTKRKYVVRVCDIESTLAEMARTSASALVESRSTLSSSARRSPGRPRKVAKGAKLAQ